MLVKLSGLVTALAGSVGGMTFQRSPDGTVARTKPLPIRRSGSYNATARQRMATLNNLWSAMTVANKNDWDTFAGTVSWFNRFGDPVSGSGYKAFLRCNMSSHASKSEVAPPTTQLTYPLSTSSVLPAVPEFVYDTATDLLELQSTDADVNANTQLFLFASQPFKAGRRFNYRPMPFLVLVNSGKTFPRDITTEYTLLYGRKPAVSVLESAFLRVQASNEVNRWPGLSTTLRLIYK